MKNKRSKYWALILYEDSEIYNYNEVFEYIKTHFDYVGILHDKDGVKNHFHFVLKFNNYKWLSSLVDELNIPFNYFESINSYNSMLLYLIHFDYKDKYNYSINDVFGNHEIISKLNKLIKTGNLSEEEKFIMILDYIDNSDFISFSNFYRYCCSIGVISFVRGYGVIIKSLIEEHNSYYIKKMS